MSLCSHCRTVHKPEDLGGVLRLTHPLPHTLSKLRRTFGERYRLDRSPPDGLAVVMPAGARDDVLALLEGTLSVSERQDCKVLLLAEGEPLASGSQGGKPARPLWFTRHGWQVGAVVLLPVEAQVALVSAGGTVTASTTVPFGARAVDTEEVVDRVAAGGGRAVVGSIKMR